MPEIFRAYGYTFFFFSHDHLPIHVHVLGNGGDAKFEWNGDSFELKEQHNIKLTDLRKIKLQIKKNRELIIRHWHDHFGEEEDDENY